MIPPENPFDEIARRVVELANDFADETPGTDVWDIADGVLSAAVHYWLYSRQPCGDPGCEDCAPVSTSGLRETALAAQVREAAVQSDYYHTPNDSDAAWA